MIRRRMRRLPVELGAAVEEVVAAGTPCFVQVIEDRCPHVTAAAAELGLTERGRVVGMVTASSGVRDAPDIAVSVRRVDKDEELRLALDVAAAGFGSPKRGDCRAVHPAAPVGSRRLLLSGRG